MSAFQSQRLSSLATCSAVVPTHSVNRETGKTQEEFLENWNKESNHEGEVQNKGIIGPKGGLEDARALKQKECIKVIDIEEISSVCGKKNLRCKL